MEKNPNNDIIETLSRCPLFANLDRGSLEFIAEWVETETFSPGEIIVQEGVVGDKMYVIHSGRVEIRQDLNFHLSRKLRIFGPGNYFGEVALMSDKSIRSASVIAMLEGASCLVVSKPKFEAIIKSAPKIALVMSKHICERDHDNLNALKTDLNNAFRSIVTALGSIAEFRDPETGEHLARVSAFSRELATYLQGRPGFEAIDNHFIELIALSSPLHDIGKVAIPDLILLKPGKLNHDEWQVMKTHTTYGWRAIEKILKEFSYPDFLKMGQNIALSHQEFWDGNGYPDKLTGEAIPLEARLMAVADIYDALRSRRPYKEPMTHEQAKAIISEKRGTHLQPELVDAFLALEKRFEQIYTELHD